MKLHSMLLAGAPLVAALGLSIAAPAATAPRANPVKLEKLPYSAGVLMARQIHAGNVHLVRSAKEDRIAPPLSCTRAPCAFPNVQVSSGAEPNNETPIAADPTNQKNLITGSNNYSCSTSLQGYFVSTNAGRTWRASCGTLAPGATGGDGEPVVGYDLAGSVYRGGIDTTPDGLSEIVVAKSADHGITWSTPAVATKIDGMFADKPWLEVDNNASSPFVKTVYVSSTQFDSSNNSTIYVAHSSDGGATWTNVPVDMAFYPKVEQFSDLAVAYDGTVYVSYLECAANGPTGDCGGTKAAMLGAKSTDGGNTWSFIGVIDRPNLAPDSCGAFYGCLPNTSEPVSDIPVIAYGSGGPRIALYAIDYNWTGSFMQVQSETSGDLGATWSAPVPLAPSTNHDQFFPWINVSPKGLVGATWLDRRDDPGNVEYETFGGVSRDGGATFSNLLLSSAMSDPFNDGFGGSFMGDYTGNAWAGLKNLYASWTDTRSGMAEDEVGGLKQ